MTRPAAAGSRLVPCTSIRYGLAAGPDPSPGPLPYVQKGKAVASIAVGTAAWRPLQPVCGLRATDRNRIDRERNVTNLSLRMPTAAASLLLESDAAYFEAGAVVHALEGAVLARIPGLERLPAAAVVQRVNPAAIAGSPDCWLDDVEELLRVHRIRHARIYLRHAPAEIESALRRRGYEENRELGLVRLTGLEPVAGEEFPAVTLEEVCDVVGWREKLAIHAATGTHPDGRRADAAEWCGMERHRVHHGYMRPYLIRAGRAVCGTVCVADRGQLLRFKNLLIQPDWRRRGYAMAAVAEILRLAAGRHAMVGCFALAGGMALPIYHRAGFVDVTGQTEWIRPLCA